MEGHVLKSIKKSSFAACLAATGMLCLPPTLVQGQVLNFTVVLPAAEFGSPNYLRYLVNSFAVAQSFCSQLPSDAYTVDCLAERMGAISSTIPEDSDYAQVQEVLADTSRKLEQLARANRDIGADRVRLSAGGETPVTTSRALTPVRADAVDTVNAQAIAILEEAETILLRSAEQSDRRQVQYTQIAEAIGSNKVLLRAA